MSKIRMLAGAACCCNGVLLPKNGKIDYVTAGSSIKSATGAPADQNSHRKNPKPPICGIRLLAGWPNRERLPNYRSSDLFKLVDRMLSVQQLDGNLKEGDAWDYYFPWTSLSTSPERDFDPSFYKFLKLSYSRPRDIVTMVQILQEKFKAKLNSSKAVFTEQLFDSNEFQNKYSEYLMGGIKDQLSFYYNNADYNMFLNFFNFLDGKHDFNYEEYIQAYNKFTDFVLNNHTDIPEFIETQDTFLQFLFDTNILCYIEELDCQPFFRWCYRERSPSNISPKVKPGERYRIHYGLHKALNVGAKRKRV